MHLCVVYGYVINDICITTSLCSGPIDMVHIFEALDEWNTGL